ncbi:hypothetical protein GL218_02534 [Daldinia childiae]|uniref:uncharacterized protein n=1 Tax=Daldinia childiae TaxID=326645 RepID=UPI0014467CA6|nr:uncharacterized protein GL218_02534 [Daldinia childiae]KAF3065068.1 hypothetical protein GL218_02534 [Daldinia childiae]
MGRLEPLTSLALGRSPYDDVVLGEGEQDPHEPEKQYDGTGRIVNPRTKRIIKDIIRAHNEVMLVIGVAEPENNGISPADIEITRQYHEYESDTGRTLYQAGTTLGILGTWGVLNIRRRILRQAIPESPTLGTSDRDVRPQNLESDATTSLALDVQSNGETVPVGSIRRQSTFSSRGGEDYGTDEEDSEMVNPTLISFDVDTSESTEPPTGVWSAELRPSLQGDSRQQPKETPRYIVNPLTKLPSSFAADILANFITNILFLPIDIYAFPIAARALAYRRGLPYEGMNIGGGVTWSGIFNIVQLDVVKLLISGEIWAFTTIVSQWLHVTEEEWKEIRKEEDQE